MKIYEKSVGVVLCPIPLSMLQALVAARLHSHSFLSVYPLVSLSAFSIEVLRVIVLYLLLGGLMTVVLASGRRIPRRGRGLVPFVNTVSLSID